MFEHDNNAQPARIMRYVAESHCHLDRSRSALSSIAYVIVSFICRQSKSRSSLLTRHRRITAVQPPVVTCTFFFSKMKYIFQQQ